MIGDLGGLDPDFTRHNNAGVVTAVGANTNGAKRTLVEGAGFNMKASATMRDGGFMVSAIVPHGDYIVFGSPYHVGLARTRAVN